MNAITFPQLIKKNFNNYEIQLSFQQDLIIISIHMKLIHLFYINQILKWNSLSHLNYSLHI